jgi:hypothetical protein
MPEIKKAAEKLPQTEKIHTLTQKVEYRKEYKNQGVFAALSLGQLRTDPSCNTNNSSQKRNAPYRRKTLPIVEKGLGFFRTGFSPETGGGIAAAGFGVWPAGGAATEVPPSE